MTTQSPRSRDIVTKTDPWEESITKIDVTQTDESIDRMIDHTRDVITMIAPTIVIHHAQTARIVIIIERINLVAMTEDTPRLLMPRTARVDTTPIMWTQATRIHVCACAPVALSPPSRKLREFECPLCQGLFLTAPAPRVMKRIITSGLISP